MEPVVAAIGVRRLDRVQHIEAIHRVGAKLRDLLEEVLNGAQPAHMELQEERVAGAWLDGPEPGLESTATLGADAVEVLPGARSIDATARREPTACEARQHREEPAPGRRPDMSDRVLDELHELIGGALAFDREQREHGGLCRRQPGDRHVLLRHHGDNLLLHFGVVQPGLPA